MVVLGNGMAAARAAQGGFLLLVSAAMDGPRDERPLDWVKGIAVLFAGRL